MSATTRLSDTEALMWSVERDPALRSTFVNVTFLDQVPDVDRFRRRMLRAIEVVPRLRQRVTGGPPRGFEWADDPDFDIDFHIRHTAVPSPGSDRQLLDAAAVTGQDAFDPSRPLWQLTIVEGLEGGRAALLAKMHHTITDGVGGVRMSALFLDLDRDAGDEPLVGAEEPKADRSMLGAVGDALRRTVGDPIGTAQSVARQLIITDQAHSPLWAGHHSMRRQFDILRVDLDQAKTAAKALGGTINDLYVTGVAGGAGRYHQALGAAVEELRMSMPVSTRNDRSAAGNAFAPARVLVPTNIDDPVARFEAVRERLGAVKQEQALAMAGSVAGLLTTLPSPLVVRLARSQVETVDFACSNVRGAPFDLYVAGARVLANHPMGPTAGTAFNATLLSYRGSMDIGVNTDVAAVTDPELLTQSIGDALDEVVAAGT